MKNTVPKKKPFLAQASIAKRFFAFAIDIFIVNWIILWPFTRIIDNLMPASSFTEALQFAEAKIQFTGSLAGVIVSLSLVTILYFVIFEKKFGQSPGKMIFNLYVVSQEKELKNWQLFVRSVFLIYIFPFILMWIIDPIVMFFTKENQRLLEILSRTKVMEEYRI